jgi:branched-chain amino acid transport system ATP-binding protein
MLGVCRLPEKLAAFAASASRPAEPGRATDMRHRKALLLSGGQQKLVALGRALGIGTKCLLLDEPFEGIAPAFSERLSEMLATPKGGDLILPMSQSDMNHSRRLVDLEFTIERGANLVSG